MKWALVIYIFFTSVNAHSVSFSKCISDYFLKLRYKDPNFFQWTGELRPNPKLWKAVMADMLIVQENIRGKIIALPTYDQIVSFKLRLINGQKIVKNAPFEENLLKESPASLQSS